MVMGKEFSEGKGREGIRYKFVSSLALVLSDPLLSPLPVNNNITSAPQTSDIYSK